MGLADTKIIFWALVLSDSLGLAGGCCRELSGTRWPRGWAAQAGPGWAGLDPGLRGVSLDLLSYLQAPPHCPLSFLEEGAPQQGKQKNISRATLE